jgi:hypothetical protein
MFEGCHRQPKYGKTNQVWSEKGEKFGVLTGQIQGMLVVKVNWLVDSDII